jgi:hypothetical protein
MMRRWLAAVRFAAVWFVAGLLDLVDPPDNHGEQPRTKRVEEGTWP